MASDIKVNNIKSYSGNTLTLGQATDTVNVVGTLDGSGLTGLNADNLTSGTVPDARFPATLPAASGANLTSLPSANLTGALPAIDGSALTGVGGGKVAQVVFQNFTTAFTTTSATYADTGLTLAITPTASDSKLYITANMNQITHNGASFGSFKMFEGGTELEEWYKGTGYSDNTTNSITLCIQRDASSTSARTYKIQMANNPNTGGTLRLNNPQADGFSAQSNMMIMEVLA